MKRTTHLVTTTLALLALAATSAAAQTMPERMPRHSFQLRFGYFFPQGEGTLWDDSASRFALAPDDFNGPAWGLSFVSAVNDNFEIGVHEIPGFLVVPDVDPQTGTDVEDRLQT
jgi:hypothetical protein